MALPTAADALFNLDALAELLGFNPTVIGDVIVDVCTSYTPSRDADISEHPVEAGFDIANARVIRPQSLTMDCILTDPDFSGSNIAMAAISGTLGNLTTSWRDKRDRLNEIFEADELITVATYEKTYDNMVIKSIIPDRRASTANSYAFTIELQEIRVIESDFFGISPDDIPKEVVDAASDQQKTVTEKVKPKKQQKGSRSTTAATEGNETILHGLTGGV
jgi:hypothetical protein